MNDKIKINLQMAGAAYPLTINREDEEIRILKSEFEEEPAAEMEPETEAEPEAEPTQE